MVPVLLWLPYPQHPGKPERNKILSKIKTLFSSYRDEKYTIMNNIKQGEQKMDGLASDTEERLQNQQKLKTMRKRMKIFGALLAIFLY